MIRSNHVHPIIYGKAKVICNVVSLKKNTLYKYPFELFSGQKHHKLAIVSASAGVPPAAALVTAAPVGSAGGRLWRQSLHLSALLSSVSWRDDKCNHQENNIILYYLPRLYQVPLPTLCSAARQRYFQVWNGISDLRIEFYFFEKNLWNDSSDTCDNLHICCETYWICRFYYDILQCFSDFTTMEFWRASFFCTRIIACEKTKCYNFLCKLWGSLHMNYKLALVF